jgi:hypothetical protein
MQSECGEALRSLAGTLPRVAIPEDRSCREIRQNSTCEVRKSSSPENNFPERGSGTTEQNEREIQRLPNLTLPVVGRTRFGLAELDSSEQ